MSDSMSGYFNNMKDSLKEWGIEIDTLRARADKASAGVRTELYRQIEVLRGKQQEVSTRLQHLMDATGPAWHDFARGIERAVRDLRSSVEKSTKTSK
jgi:hypothetical protein